MRFLQEECLNDISRRKYMRSAEGFLIVYSVTSLSSFHEVSKFRDQILRVRDADTVPIVIVGNKARVPCCCMLAAAFSWATVQRVARPSRCTFVPLTHIAAVRPH